MWGELQSVLSESVSGSAIEMEATDAKRRRNLRAPLAQRAVRHKLHGKRAPGAWRCYEVENAWRWAYLVTRSEGVLDVARREHGARAPRQYELLHVGQCRGGGRVMYSAACCASLWASAFEPPPDIFSIASAHDDAMPVPGAAPRPLA